MIRFALRPGFELRGMMIRLYPTTQQIEALEELESELRRCWNWLCKQTQEVVDARASYAVRQGLVGPKPIRPGPPIEGTLGEDIQATWDAYHDAMLEWYRSIYAATDKLPCCAWRPRFKEMIALYSCDDRPLKFDYQFLREVVLCGDTKLCAHALQALVKNFFSGRAADGSGRAKGQRRKQFRRSGDPMPLQVRSGDCLELGDYTPEYSKTGHHRKYDCRVSFNGLKIVGRLPGRAPWGRIIEGVSISKQADGWWASIKQEIPIRQIPNAIPGSTIGIDAGLDIIAAMSDGRMVRNPREKEYSERIAGRQALKKPVGRLQQRAARHVRHLIYNEVVKPLANVEEIKVEKLTGRIGQMGSRKTSSMRTMVQILKDRYGNRVREVECFYTSQDCSQCGHRSKDSWSYEHGPIGKCPVCGLELHRDINAARNIASKASILQDAAE